jgi:protein-S-isoprenylcysteine O-methyltransferase Ste14
VPVVSRARRIHAHIPLAILALVLARPSPIANLVGTGVVLAGIALRVWAAGVLRKGGGLCTGGPYRIVRHPLYAGSLVAALGFSIMMNVVWAWVLVFPLFVVLYAGQVLAEERDLRARYGEAHREWAQRVPMLLPTRPAAPGRGREWRMSQVLANREHYHAAVTLALAALFHVKAHWGWW